LGESKPRSALEQGLLSPVSEAADGEVTVHFAEGGVWRKFLHPIGAGIIAGYHGGAQRRQRAGPHVLGVVQDLQGQARARGPHEHALAMPA
jgi:hypothetical protein